MVQVVKKMACNARRHILEKNEKYKDDMKKEDEQDHRNGTSQGERKQCLITLDKREEGQPREQSSST